MKGVFMERTDLITVLRTLDEKASRIIPLGNKIVLTIAGGSALILGGHIKRSTTDIDILDNYPELQSLFGKYDVNNRINAYADSLAENYEDRLVKFDLETKAIDYYLLSLEDIVIMKLFSNRTKDYKDIREKDVINNLNWELLDKIISSGEADISFNQTRYKQFLERYEEYKKEFSK